MNTNNIQSFSVAFLSKIFCLYILINLYFDNTNASFIQHDCSNYGDTNLPYSNAIFLNSDDPYNGNESLAKDIITNNLNKIECEFTEQLPNETIIHIFQHLFMSDIINIRIVCQKFCKLTNDNHLWYHIWMDEFTLKNVCKVPIQSYNPTLDYQNIIKLHWIPLFEPLSYSCNDQVMHIDRGSSDGTTMVGWVEDISQKRNIKSVRDVIWSRNNKGWVPQFLPLLNKYDEGLVKAISDNGTTLVGWIGNYKEDNIKAVVWSCDNNNWIVKILPTRQDKHNSIARSISADGKTIIGWTFDNDSEDDTNAVTWHWNQGNWILNLLPLSETNSICKPKSVSADGQIIVGWEFLTSKANIKRAVIWNRNNNNWTINNLFEFNDFLSSTADVISANGQIIMGSQKDIREENNATTIITWHRNYDKWNVSFVPSLNEDMNYCIKTMSADGETIGGHSYSIDKNKDQQEAFIYRNKSAIPLKLLLQQLMPENKLLKNEQLNLINIKSISVQGQIIIGEAILENYLISYRAIIPPNINRFFVPNKLNNLKHSMSKSDEENSFKKRKMMNTQDI